MDPALFALFGTLGGGIVLKIFENHLKRRKKSRVPAIPEGYGNRWLNPAYVEMIHQTIRQETSVFGEAMTTCKCKACTSEPQGCGLNGCGKTMCDKVCNPGSIKEPKVLKRMRARQGESIDRFLAQGDNGEYYPITEDDYHRLARSIRKDRQYQTYISKVGANYYRPNDKKPVQEISYRKEPRNHIMFYPSGPKMMTETEMRENLGAIVASARKMKEKEDRIEQKLNKSIDQMLKEYRTDNAAQRINTTKGKK